MSENTITLDVREDIKAGREPFSTIMAAVGRLAAKQSLLLIAPFEPVPLFHVLAKRGFAHVSKQTPAGDWQVVFSRDVAMPDPTAAVPAISSGCACDANQSSEIVDLDARGLEPPQPLVAILEAIATLRSGATLRAQTDRRPMHLYSQLEARSFTGESTEQPDGSFITHIRHS
jgi:uncharacterized protein (DUF2249 family)